MCKMLISYVSLDHMLYSINYDNTIHTFEAMLNVYRSEATLARLLMKIKGAGDLLLTHLLLGHSLLQIHCL